MRSWLVLTATGLMLSPRRPAPSRCSLSEFGVFVEVAQSAMGFGRDADWHDVAAELDRDRGRLHGLFSDPALLALAPMTPRHRPWEDAADFAIGLKPIPLGRLAGGRRARPGGPKGPALRRAARSGLGPKRRARGPAETEVRALVDEALGAEPAPADLPPLYAAARRLPDDLCLMEKRDGQWRLAALSLSPPASSPPRG